MILERYKAIWAKIEDLKNIKLNALPVYDDRYIKTKIRTFGEKVYTNFRDLNVPEDYIECESFTVISIDSLLVYNKKYYLQEYLDNRIYKVVNKQMTDTKSSSSKECMICHYWFFNHGFKFQDYVCNGGHDLKM